MRNSDLKAVLVSEHGWNKQLTASVYELIALLPLKGGTALSGGGRKGTTGAVLVHHHSQ
jgi:hypothetical protein